MTESARGRSSLIALGVSLVLLGGLAAWSSIGAGDDDAGVIVLGGDPDDDRSVIVIKDGQILTGHPGKKFKFLINRGDEGGPYLGVALREETEHPEGGARITAVAPDSPAGRAGLKEDDIIVGLNGDPIRGPIRLTERIRSHSLGDEVTLDVIRDGNRQTFNVELEERPEAYGFYWGGDDGPKFFSFGSEGEVREYFEDLKENLKGLRDLDIDIQGLGEVPKRFRVDVPHLRLGPHGLLLGHRPKLGVQLVEITPELREHLGGTRDSGVLVSKVLTGTPAEYVGIQVGDLITTVDGQEISDARDLIRAIRDKDGETAEIELIRDGRTMTLQVEFPEREEEGLPTGPRALHPHRIGKPSLAQTT